MGEGPAAAPGPVVGSNTLIDESGLPRHEAVRLLLTASGLEPLGLLAVDGIDPDTAAGFRELVKRRRQGEPLQYLEGSVQFGPLELIADSRALIPRPETEQLWELAVSAVGAGQPRVVVDLCTGSGNLALALKHEFRRAKVYGTDDSPEALSLAAENEVLTGLEVEWCAGDLFAALPGDLRRKVDLLVANPPYLAEAEAAALPTDVREHEPRRALIAGPRGDETVKRIAEGAADWLIPGGIIACEISEFQQESIARMFRRYAGKVLSDLTGRPRFVIGRLPAT